MVCIWAPGTQSRQSPGYMWAEMTESRQPQGYLGADMTEPRTSPGYLGGLNDRAPAIPRVPTRGLTGLSPASPQGTWVPERIESRQSHKGCPNDWYPEDWYSEKLCEDLMLPLFCMHALAASTFEI